MGYEQYSTAARAAYAASRNEGGAGIEIWPRGIYRCKILDVEDGLVPRAFQDDPDGAGKAQMMKLTVQVQTPDGERRKKIAAYLCYLHPSAEAMAIAQQLLGSLEFATGESKPMEWEGSVVFVRLSEPRDPVNSRGYQNDNGLAEFLRKDIAKSRVQQAKEQLGAAPVVADPELLEPAEPVTVRDAAAAAGLMPPAPAGSAVPDIDEDVPFAFPLFYFGQDEGRPRWGARF